MWNYFFFAQLFSIHIVLSDKVTDRFCGAKEGSANEREFGFLLGGKAGIPLASCSSSDSEKTDLLVESTFLFHFKKKNIFFFHML